MWQTMIGLLTVSVEKDLKKYELNFITILLEWGTIAPGFKLHRHQSNKKKEFVDKLWEDLKSTTIFIIVQYMANGWPR